MKKSLIALVAVIVLGIFWQQSRKETEPSPVSEEPLGFAVTLDNSETESVGTLSPAPILTSSAETRSWDSYFQSFKNVGACLPTVTLPQMQDEEPSLQFWNNHFQSIFGSIVFDNQEWYDTYLTLSNGEQRQIRIAYEMTEDDEYVKRLTYTAYGADGTIIPVEIPAEKLENPDEGYIASLELEGDVTLKQSAHRIYFRDNTEIFAVEKNGIVSDLEISKDGKVFRCQNLTSSAPQCSCL